VESFPRIAMDFGHDAEKYVVLYTDAFDRKRWPQNRDWTREIQERIQWGGGVVTVIDGRRTGDRPTIDRVRMKLGRGSPNTINDHLDAWWSKLGARLRDLPGQEFPHLPERVAQALQHLWAESAHAVLRDALSARERILVQDAQALQARERELTEREHAAAARATALEDSLSLAREQLTAANQRAERLEATLQERQAEADRARTRLNQLEQALGDLRSQQEKAETAHQGERARLRERHASAEARWLVEVDRARQSEKNAAKEHDRQLRSLGRELDTVRTQGEALRQQLADAQSEQKAASAVRQQLEAQLIRIQLPRAFFTGLPCGAPAPERLSATARNQSMFTRLSVRKARRT
jgi:hypothetical protein